MICALAYKFDLYVVTYIYILYAMAYSVDMDTLARTPKQIGSLIQRARTQRDWTQRHLADRAGLRQATISAIESGETPAKLDTILAVLAALDLEFRVTARSKGEASDIEEIF